MGKELNVIHVIDVQMVVNVGFIGYGNQAKRLEQYFDSDEIIIKSKFHPTKISDPYNAKNIKDLLIQQTCSKVKWRQSIINCIKLSKNVLEIGSGKVLSGMNKRINKDINTQNISTLEDLDLFLNLNKENI